MFSCVQLCGRASASLLYNMHLCIILSASKYATLSASRHVQPMTACQPKQKKQPPTHFKYMHTCTDANQPAHQPTN